MRFWKENGATRILALLVCTGVIIVAGFAITSFVPYGRITYSSEFSDGPATSSPAVSADPVSHLATPNPLKALYMTACTASERRLRGNVLANFDNTELNAIVIDIKDYTGTDSYASTSMQSGAGIGHGCRIRDLAGFIASLHARGIYVIGRVTVFQDPLYASLHPDLAIQSKSRPGSPWRDKNGLAYLDPSAKPYWDYIVGIGREAYGIGVDELNFDYIRFPSDGNLSDMSFTWSAGKPKAEAVTSFFRYLREQFSSTTPDMVNGGLPVLSADLFGLTTTAEDDMGIGQLLTHALPYFDYVAPMVYPSHFASGYIGFAKPAQHPYDVIHYSMDKAASRALQASTSPAKLRPWIQAFDLGAIYTPAMVRSEMQATYDAGLSSWMLWNAGSAYTRDYLAPAGVKDNVSPTAGEQGSTTQNAARVPAEARIGEAGGR